MRVICWSLALMLLAGCGPAQTPPNPNASGMTVKATASDIAIYDPATSGQIVDPAKLGASYAKAAANFDAVEEIEAFHKEHGRYPEDYAEFKSGVVEPNGLRFPDNLPFGYTVQYDEKNHRVVIVSGKPAGKKGK